MVYEVELAIFGAFAGLSTPISIYLAKKMIEPVFQLRELISEISYSLTFYANIYAGPGNSPKHHEVSDILRQHASNLKSKFYLIKYPRIPTFVGLIPSKSDIEAAHKHLIGISNMLFNNRFTMDIIECHEKIEKLLAL